MHIYPTLLEEHGKHGTVSFPLKVHSVDSSTDTEEKIYCHWHNEIELLYIRKGNAILQIGEQQYPIHTGDVILVPPGSVHMVNGDRSPFSFTAVVFLPELIQSCMQQIIQAEQIREDGYELTIKIRILQILQEIYRLVKDFRTDDITVDERSKLLKAMVVYLHEHENMTVHLEEMADTFHLSKGHLCRFFRALTNMTIIEYLNYYRINRSVYKLKHTDLSISEIAQQTGFPNISYFNRTFRKYMHQSPGQFRKNI